MPTIESTLRNQLVCPSNYVAETSQLVGLAAGRVRRWLERHEYSDSHVVHSQPPVLQGNGSQSPYASFLDLVDLLLVKKILEHGVSLQNVHRAFLNARMIFGTKHFAKQEFFMDGGAVFYELVRGNFKERGSVSLEVMPGWKRSIASDIRRLARQIDFESSGGLASRWYPLVRNRPVVVLDPMVAFGAPSITGRGISTNIVFDLFIAENESLASVQTWWGLTDAEIHAAVEFERQLKA